MKNYFLLLLLLLVLTKTNAQCDSAFLRYTGTLIKDAAVINENMIIAAGDNGYVIKSADGGKSWRNIPVNKNGNLFNAIQFPSDSIGYIAGNGGIMKTEDQGESWFPLANINPATESYNDLFFFDKNHGFVVGTNGRILSTANGGRSFKDTTLGSYLFYSIDFINDSTGLAAGYDVLFKTTDKGKTWNKIDISSVVFGLKVFKIKYVTNAVVYAVGYPGLFMKSTDGGSTWTKYDVPSGSGGVFYDVHFFNKDSGIVVGEYSGGGFIMSTIDGGQSFSVDFDNAAYTGSCYTLDADAAEKKFIIAGGGGYDVFGYNGRTMLTSTDKGTTWTKQSANRRITYYHTQTLNDSTAIISGGGGAMLKTYDYGESWKPLASIPSSLGNPPYMFSFPDSLHGYAATEDLYATVDGGKSWVKKTLPGMPQSFVPMHMTFTDSVTGFVIDYGTIYKTINSGASWTQAGIAPNSAFLNDIIFTPNGKGFAVGYNGSVLVSTNGGNSWQTYDLHSAEYLRSVYFYNNTIGFIGTSDSIIYKTTDAGSSWTKINTHIRGIHFLSFAFKDNLNGYMLGNNNTGNSVIYRTKDGGDTWVALRGEPENIRNIAGSNTLYYAGEDGLIAKSEQLSKPSVPGYIKGDDTSCINLTKYYSTLALNNLTYTWTLQTGGNNKYKNNVDTVYWTQTGNHTLSVAAQNYCGAGPQRSIVVNVIDFKPLISQKDSVLTASTGTSYQWYFNDVAIPAAQGGTSVSIVAKDYGAYKVTVQSFYGCTVTSDVYNYSVLPVQLLNFTARLANADAVLNWSTASEINSNYFDIERSLDGLNFVAIGKVKAAGNSSVLLQYQYRDKNVAFLNSNFVYYRLKEVEKDGTYLFSKVQLLSVRINETIAVTPNPFTTSFQLNILSHSMQAANIIVAGMNGTVMVNEKRSLAEGNNVIQYNTVTWAPGTYGIKVKFEDGATATVKAVKN